MIINPKIINIPVKPFKQTIIKTENEVSTDNPQNLSFGVQGYYMPNTGKRKIAFQGNSSEINDVIPNIKGTAEGRLIVAKDKNDLLNKIYSSATREPIIAYIDSQQNLQDNNYMPYSIKGIITTGRMDFDYNTHFELMLKQRKIKLLYIPYPNKDSIKKFDGKFVRIDDLENGVKFTEIEKLSKDIDSPKKPDIQDLKPLTTPLRSKEYEKDTVGPKAYNLKLLEERNIKGAKIPPSITLPCGIFNEVMDAKENVKIKEKYEKAIKDLDGLSYEKTGDRLCQIRGLIFELKISENIEKKINESVKENVGSGLKAVRSAFNGEDTEGYSAAGLYNSAYSNDQMLMFNIKDVWASKWNEGAYWSRCDMDIPHESIKPTVIIQKLISADASFVINSDEDHIEIKMAKGLGEALTKDPMQDGQEIPYTFIYDKNENELHILKSSNRNNRFIVKEDKVICKNNRKAAIEDMVNQRYGEATSMQALDEYPHKLLGKIVDTALDIEKKWGKLQNIEGCITEPSIGCADRHEIFIVQTRDM